MSLVLTFQLQACFTRYQFVAAMALVVVTLIVVMAGMLYVLTYHMRRSLANMPTLLLAGVMYALSLYSFVFVALAGLG